jgi:lipoate-protein ligase A
VSRGSGLSAGDAPWRLIVDPPEDGSWNMAVDEAILEAYERAAEKRAPTLRLYGWRPAALSLGRAQRAGGTLGPRLRARCGVDLVRRPTGGSAVLHEFERTYAVVGALGFPPFTGGVIDTFKLVAGAVKAGLVRLGVAASAIPPRGGSARAPGAACFERTGAWEIEAAGRKLVGAAQARRRGAFLQHGSIPKHLDPGRLQDVVGQPVDGSRFIDLGRVLGGAVDDVAIDRALAAGFEQVFGISLLPGKLTDGEALRAAELRCWKYDSIAWTIGGSIGAREARWGPVVRG